MTGYKSVSVVYRLITVAAFGNDFSYLDYIYDANNTSMGLSQFLKKIIQGAREGNPVRDEHKILEKEPPVRNPVNRVYTDDEFDNNMQLHKELMAYALWKYEENNNDYEAARKSLADLDGIQLSGPQTNKIIEKLKLFNEALSRKDRFKSVVAQAQDLVNNRQQKEAFDFAYNAYIEDSSDIDLAELVTQIAGLFSSEEEVLNIYDNLVAVNPDDSYNIRYRKALYLKAKRRFDEAIVIFEELNIELEFAWNYYQIAIMQNLVGNTDYCLDQLKKTFALDPQLKADAKKYHELANLQQEPDFIAITR